MSDNKADTLKTRMEQAEEGISTMQLALDDTIKHTHEMQIALGKALTIYDRALLAINHYLLTNDPEIAQHDNFVDWYIETVIKPEQEAKASVEGQPASEVAEIVLPEEKRIILPNA